MDYGGARVLVTGGLGFIGSNLSIRLVERGAQVTIVDAAVPGCGANLQNIAPVANKVRLIPRDMADAEQFASELEGVDVVFNLAGEISHMHSMKFPERDLHLNTLAQLRFLLVLRRISPGVRVVYASTRQVFGVPEYLPVDEEHRVQPVDFNGIHKYAASMYHMMLTRGGEIDAVVLRLTNVYGPRMALRIPCQGVLNVFLRRLLTGQRVTVYGDGGQLRDPLYVDDAVDAFLAAGAIASLPARTYNTGGPEPLSLLTIASIASEAAGCDSPQLRPFPAEQRAIDIGDYVANVTRISRDLKWTPLVTFQDGIQRTIAYYRSELSHYLDPDCPEPACDLPEHDGVPRRLTYLPI